MKDRFAEFGKQKPTKVKENGFLTPFKTGTYDRSIGKSKKRI